MHWTKKKKQTNKEDQQECKDVKCAVGSLPFVLPTTKVILFPAGF